jgi:cell division protein ZapB
MRDSSTYSAHMQTEMKSLEDKVEQIVEACIQLRTENTQLRQQLAAAQNDNKRLSDKIQGAHTRLETLLESVPENAE